MKIEYTTETRTVSNIAKIEVENVAVLVDTRGRGSGYSPSGVLPMIVGKGTIKVIRKVDGGYTVRTVGKNSLVAFTQYPWETSFLLIDSERIDLSAIFK